MPERLTPEAEARFWEGVRAGSEFFQGRGAVYRTLARVKAILAERAIPYAIIGDMALNEYGYRRATDHIELLLSSEEAVAFAETPASFEVPVRMVIAGEFPGMQNAVRYPSPIAGARYLPIETFVELKLASGTAPQRLRDLADVLDLIRVAKLPAEFGERLDPSVRAKFRELWEAAQGSRD